MAAASQSVIWYTMPYLDLLASQQLKHTYTKHKIHTIVISCICYQQHSLLSC